MSGVDGKYVKVKAEERVLSEKDKIDPAKLQALMFDQFQNGYYVTGDKVGKAWNAGVGLMKKWEKIIIKNLSVADEVLN